MRHALHSAYKSVAERVTPVLTESAFAERGVLTPDEFVRAGDFLVRTCPTWSWESGDPSKRKSYLPKEKQYLVTRGVPSRRRASAVEGYGGGEGGEEEGDEEGWVAPPPADHDGGAVDAAAVDAGDEKEEEAEGKEAAKGGAADDDDDDVPDLEDLELVDEDDIDEAALPPSSVAASAAARAERRRAAAPEPDGDVVRVRTYDLSISYDKYYQVPRFWLAGFDESRRPLSNDALLEDVAAEHARKTVTVEPHPHHSASAGSSGDAPVRVASIHPCRHASVMKKLASMGAGGGGGGGGEGATSTTSSSPPSSSFDPEAYLVLFLKFISSVIPTIEYDFTMHAPLGGGGGGSGGAGRRD